MALIQAGLQIELLQEYPFVRGWDPLPGLERDAEGWVRPRDPELKVPLMYSIRATKPVEGSSNLSAYR